MRTEPISRRELFVGRSVARAATICPPGATPESLEACTGCGRCAERCPSGIIRLSDGGPSIDFALGECTFCGECSAACPEPVFLSKGATQFPHVAVVSDTCLAKRDVSCQSCGECCPEQAIRFRPRIGGPFVPELNEEICTGCGACLSVCPVGAIGLQARQMEAANA
ncbi:ferredoxin-type protein NapF [Rhizobium sp. ARZ01]|nr:ferredoxin-type protein NapF [Rhizobium sp. ARZ01]MBD9371108.1 ferredoxin-type protein NapF [Rhizobium sp. ARZ01]